MILDMDDLKYTVLEYRWLPITVKNLVKNCNTIDEILLSGKFGAIFHLFAKNILNSRLLEVDNIYDNVYSQFSSSIFYEYNGWPEMEEKIRTGYYKDWYEEETGTKI